MKTEDRKLLTFGLAVLIHIARIVQSGVRDANGSIMDAKSFMEQADTHNITPKLPAD